MNDASGSHFSPDYFTARARFLHAAQASGGRLEALPLEAKGPRGEELGIDIAWFGTETPRRILIHCSGLHGVEGFAGSAIQLQFVEKLPRLVAGTAIVLVHILNPYGMAWLRRVNENNVDLNRNFLSDSAPYTGASAAYSKLNTFLNPASAPAPDFFYLKAASLILRYGMKALRQGLVGGQYQYPHGLFFGGKQVEAGPQRFQTWLETRIPPVEKAVIIDVHTGLGKYGEELLFTGLRPDPGTTYTIEGGLESMLFLVFAGAEPHFIRQEFGTFSGPRVLHALREENRWHHHGSGSLEHAVKHRLKQAFCPDDEGWRRSVLRHGTELLERWLRELDPASPSQHFSYKGPRA